MVNIVKYSFFRKIYKRILLVLLVFSITIFLKLLIFDIYKIPSSSMNNTLYPGDVIMVNKLKYGPKLPRSPFEIPLVNIAFYLNNKTRATMNTQWWSYKRLPGTTTVKNGDVFVFTMFKKNMIIVKRCMGVAGDTLKIEKGEVYVNNKILRPSKLILNNYKFKIKDKKKWDDALDSIGLDITINKIQDNYFGAALSHEEKKRLQKLSIVSDLIKYKDSLTLESSVYPKSQYNQWNLDDYGPYIVPKKGMEIKMTPENYALYSKAINSHEDVEIKKNKDDYYLNEKRITHYTFKQDYYFMMGDNRKGSLDSRRWGVVPECRIIGKVQCVLFSYYQNKFRWNRLFKSVN
ncbi:signal peptidase I [uncultured Maribacter sp.]|uniref:signal peptidase I n=1 Tax=uncultured Maribacter sp. TaxID=431308 RepID=UPI00260DBC43|nr:signal peptidase I [uncultured Maribacter sp.]